MVVPSSLTNTERLKNGNAELGCLLKIKENKEIKNLKVKKLKILKS